MARLVFMLIFLGIITYLKCSYKDHTPGYKITSHGLTDDEREDFLRWHNEFRQEVALDNEPQQPKAADTIQLVWNNELKMIAQRWTSQNDTSAPDKNRRSQKYEYIGLNNQHERGERKCKLRIWFEVVSKYVAVGCEKMIYKEGVETITLFVCNYGPGGNLKGAIVYEEGDPCSNCENVRNPDATMSLLKCSDDCGYNPKINDKLEDMSAWNKTRCGNDGKDGGDGIEDVEGGDEDFGAIITLFLIVGLLCIACLDIHIDFDIAIKIKIY